jgi:tripartite-type tricarboxylate transporter receptor subunit TctC
MKTSVRKAATPRRRTAIRYIERRLVTQHPRRRVLSLAAGAVALPFAPRLAWGQAYPSRPVRIVVGFPPGSGNDNVARLLGQWLSERLGQPFVIENRPGATGAIGTQAVARAPADGYTLLLFSASVATNATLYANPGFNLIRDIAPIASIMRVPLVMLVHPSLSANTVSEFIAYAQANPGRIAMASSGNGSTPHVAGELFKMLARTDLLHVPYRGGAPALTDLLSGQVQVFFGEIGSSIEYIRAGTLRALAVSTTVRLDALPDIPTVAEFVPGYEASSFFGIGAPRNTPAEIIDRLNKTINEGLTDPKLNGRLADLGGTMLPGSPADFGKLIADETEKWGKVIRAANIKAE